MLKDFNPLLFKLGICLSTCVGQSIILLKDKGGEVALVLLRTILLGNNLIIG
jgi:hypothetical protein